VIAFPEDSAYALIMNSITTAQLRLVPATADLVCLEMENLPAFFEALGVQSIADWPSEVLAHALPFFRDQLTRDASLVGWLAWYWIVDGIDGCHLVGGGGFKGAPADGTVEIGYETRLPYRCKGFATEAVGAQVRWALEHPNVTHITAESHADNAGSIAVLRKLDFVHVGAGSENGLLRFERKNTDL
jgi:ribosomal-protein-alanine N-acetyltransferase